MNTASITVIGQGRQSRTSHRAHPARPTSTTADAAGARTDLDADPPISAHERRAEAERILAHHFAMVALHTRPPL